MRPWWGQIPVSISKWKFASAQDEGWCMLRTQSLSEAGGLFSLNICYLLQVRFNEHFKMQLRHKDCKSTSGFPWIFILAGLCLRYKTSRDIFAQRILILLMARWWKESRERATVMRGLWEAEGGDLMPRKLSNLEKTVKKGCHSSFLWENCSSSKVSGGCITQFIRENWWVK